jgi:hypothetical protein
MYHAPLKDMLTIQMDPLTMALAAVAILSEILPLMGFVEANGVLHAIQTFILHVHAESDCHVEVEIEAVTHGAGAAEGPAATAVVAVTPP